MWRFITVIYHWWLNSFLRYIGGRFIEPSSRRSRDQRLCDRVNRNDYDRSVRAICLTEHRSKNREPRTKTLLKRHRGKERQGRGAYHADTGVVSEVWRGRRGHSYGTVTPGASAENVSDGDRRSQRTMAVCGRRLKPALQRILRLINIVRSTALRLRSNE